jgi:hypothetical protein
MTSVFFVSPGVGLDIARRNPQNPAGFRFFSVLSVVSVVSVSKAVPALSALRDFLLAAASKKNGLRGSDDE